MRAAMQVRLLPGLFEKRCAMRPRVTLDEINNGKRCDSSNCPIALAIKREMPNSRVAVGCYYVVIDGEASILPTNAAVFLRAFDCGDPVEPFEFEINDD